MSIKTGLIITLNIGGLTFYLHAYYGELLSTLLYYTLAVMSMVLIFGLAFVGWYLSERVKVMRASRVALDIDNLIKRKEASLTIITSNGQVFIRDTDPLAVYSALHLDPRVTHGSLDNRQPTESESMNWHTMNTKQVRQLALPSPEEMEKDTPMNLIGLFTQPLRAYAIVGAQQTGKTYQARHIAAHWLENGVQPVVIGPKWDHGEWEGCKLYGGMGDIKGVESGIEVVKREAKRRHEHPTLTNRQHPILPVFFDDWTPTVRSAQNAKDLIIEGSMLYASVNIIMCFLIHADTASAWGVDAIGADLKNGFVKLFIESTIDRATGKTDFNKAKGVVRLPTEKQTIRTELFNTPVPIIHEVITNGLPEADQIIDITPIVPIANREQQDIIDMWEGWEKEGGKPSLNAITKRYYGKQSVGGNQKRVVREVLERYTDYTVNR